MKINDLPRQLLAVLVVACLAPQSRAQFVPNVFDIGSGANTYYPNSIFESFADTNWTPSFAGLVPNSGTQFFASGNGNAAHDFVDVGFTKNLGGSIENHPYTLSFFMASYSDNDALNLQPVQFADFSTLRIGGTSGTMLWTSTPTSVIRNQWYQWTGTYTPTASDLGHPFLFTAFLNLKSLHTLAIDGPISIPEPPSWIALAVGLAALGLRRSASVF
jgi:hypothetical protein